MTDHRFFQSSGPFSLNYIADCIGAEPPAPEAGSILIHDVAALETAGPGDLSLFSDPRYATAFIETRASVVVTSHKLGPTQRPSQKASERSILLAPSEGAARVNSDVARGASPVQSPRTAPGGL